MSRVILDIFSYKFLNENLAFRGGTALHTLYLNPTNTGLYKIILICDGVVQNSKTLLKE